MSRSSSSSSSSSSSIGHHHHSSTNASTTATTATTSSNRVVKPLKKGVSSSSSSSSSFSDIKQRASCHHYMRYPWHYWLLGVAMGLFMAFVTVWHPQAFSVSTIPNEMTNLWIPELPPPPRPRPQQQQQQEEEEASLVRLTLPLESTVEIQTVPPTTTTKKKTTTTSSSTSITSRSIQSVQKMFTSRPKNKNKKNGYDSTFYSHGMRAHGMIRALRSLQWIKVDSVDEALLYWTMEFEEEDDDDEEDSSILASLQSWQRYNHLNGTQTELIRTFQLASTMQNYYTTTTTNHYNNSNNNNNSNIMEPRYMMESYHIQNKDQRRQFQEKLRKGGGLKMSWIQTLVGKKKSSSSSQIVLLEANSKQLRQQQQAAAAMDDKEIGNYLFQPFICHAITHQSKTLDVRVYWLVASTDPLIVFYMDGYIQLVDDVTDVRSPNLYDKVPFSQLNDLLQPFTTTTTTKKHQKMDDVVKHVRSQMKHAIGQVVHAHRHKAFRPLGQVMEDGFELLSASFTIDSDFNVWLMHIQDVEAAQMDEDHYFRLELHHDLCVGMVTTLQEIWDKQATQQDIFPLHHTGKFEVIYADGWRFVYENYQRDELSLQTACTVDKK